MAQTIAYPDRIVTQFYTGPTMRDNFDAMDRDLARAAEHGGQLVKRGKIGRNATCPCGSGLKFKKCCIGRAALTG